MDDYIPISALNDFIFCPYSIYLHNVYMETDEGLYYAKPQIRGRIAHMTVDNKTASNRKDTKLRANFSKMLTKNGAIRLQYSVCEVNNTNRVLENLIVKIDQFATHFNGADSVIVFDVFGVKLKKYGNAIHRDTDIVYL